MENKRVLIVSMTCGEGHNSVSKAIKQKLEDIGLECKIIELFTYSQKRVQFENKLYLFACKYFRLPYDYFWKKLNKRNPEKRDSLPVHRTVKKAFGALKENIDQFAPSVIITTHPYSNVAIDDMKKLGMIDPSIKTMSVLTDYCVHPYWEAGIGLDYVITPTEQTTPELLRRGYKQQQIKVIGYPVAKKFEQQLDKAECRKQLGIEDKFTIMIMNGGNGLGNNLKLIKTILKSNKNLQILCVCGKNKKGKDQLDRFVAKNKIDNVLVYGFVNNIEVMMAASDCMFSRGGGVSITEALNANVPLIIREKMIINEKLNKDFLLQNKCALELTHINQAKDVVEHLIDNPQLLEQIRQNQQKTVNKNAASQIAEFVEKIVCQQG
jgi:processive 1,2-diacylglycerol beta-glucosyltransferase